MEIPATTDLIRLTSRLRHIAKVRNHRLTILVEGDTDWTAAAAKACLTQCSDECAWLSDRRLDVARLPLTAGSKLLGRELDALVYDAHSGFDPDSFGAAVGALRGGGLLLLLTPVLNCWHELTDPQTARIAVEPFSTEQVSGRFIARFVSVLLHAPDIIRVSQWNTISGFPPEPIVDQSNPIEGLSLYRTLDQQHAVESIVHTAHGRARRPLIITSDRGRGKTSALGIAAAQLLVDGQRRILVTAPRRSALEPLFRHAACLLPGARVHDNRIEHRNGCLQFLPPDGLSVRRETTDLLLVDEAAGIPAPMLEGMLANYPRVVFATTVHGYEGTGRGFEVRFRRSLKCLTPNHRTIELHAPIRWAELDPLEALVSRALLLDASPALDSELAGAEVESCRYDLLDRDHLSDDEATLSELFGLLVLAHYQTRPLDLRHLLDGPNIQVHVLRYGRKIAATALVAIEGGFGPDLARQVFDGRRRPRGHLLPQTLSAHAGLEEAPLLRYARVVRIAVHPAAEGRGLGRMLLQHIREQAHAGGLDLVGASFGATTDLLRFWNRCGFVPVHLGTSRNAASGAHAAVVLQSLSAEGDALQRRGGERLGQRFISLLPGPFRELEPGIAAAMLGAGALETGEAGAQALDWRELTSFAVAQRPFESALAAMNALLRYRLARALREGRLSERETSVLIGVVLQYGDWKRTAALAGATGRAGAIEVLRGAVHCLVRAYGPASSMDE